MSNARSANSEASTHSGVWVDKDIINESVFANCLEMCKQAGRLPYFYITGGDPILHSRFWDLMEMFKAYQIAFSILGNPFHLNDEVCRRLKECGCERYQLSIDGLRDTHNARLF